MSKHTAAQSAAHTPEPWPEDPRMATHTQRKIDRANRSRLEAWACRGLSDEQVREMRAQYDMQSVVGEDITRAVMACDGVEFTGDPTGLVAEMLQWMKTKARHAIGCRVNPGGPIMAALGDPNPRPCSCGLDALLARVKVAKELPGKDGGL